MPVVPAIFIQELTSMGIDPNPIAVPEPPAYPATPVLELPAYPPAPAYGPPTYTAAPSPAPAIVATPAAPKSRPAWILPAAIAVLGLIVSGTLGYLLFSTSSKLEATRHQLTGTQLALDGTKKDLSAEQAQAAYVNMYDQDIGRLSTDYGLLVECDSASGCKTAAQTMLSDTQAFQSDRSSAKVPVALSAVDGMLGDGLSAEVTALQALITAINSQNSDRIQTAFNDISDASVSVFKTEAQLGKLLQ